MALFNFTHLDNDKTASCFSVKYLILSMLISHILCPSAPTRHIRLRSIWALSEVHLHPTKQNKHKRAGYSHIRRDTYEGDSILQVATKQTCCCNDSEHKLSIMVSISAVIDACRFTFDIKGVCLVAMLTTVEKVDGSDVLSWKQQNRHSQKTNCCTMESRLYITVF